MNTLELLRREMRASIAAGRGVPRRPQPEDLWKALDGDGAACVLVTLEYLAARREALADLGIEDAPVEKIPLRRGYRTPSLA